MAKAYLVGGGIAALAAATYLIRDGGFDGADIHVFEQQRLLGGSLDAGGTPAGGYSMRGGRMFEAKFRCTYDLLSGIPSLDDPEVSVTGEILAGHEEFGWDGVARLVDGDGGVVDPVSMGFPEFASMKGIQRTRRHPYDSIVRPLTAWLGERGVALHTGCRVTDLGFAPGVRSGTVDAIHLSRHGRAETIAVAPEDLVFVTNGSMTDSSSVGSHTSAPPPAPERSDAWLLWHRLARGREAFEKFSGRPAGRDGLMTFTSSNWLLSAVVHRQPVYHDQPEDTTVWWGYGLFPDRAGNRTPKPMTMCTGREILEEVLRRPARGRPRGLRQPRLHRPVRRGARRRRLHRRVLRAHRVDGGVPGAGRRAGDDAPAPVSRRPRTLRKQRSREGAPDCPPWTLPQPTRTVKKQSG